jgi:GTP-binding protein EngB required for normal cell division
MIPHHRPNALPQCQNLQAQVDAILSLLQQEPTLRAQVDTSAARSSLKKAIAPTFEIVFAGAFSAGKSMLINAILERELLCYGHRMPNRLCRARARAGSFNLLV